jgi:NAD(P)H-hydrate epimerase
VITPHVGEAALLLGTDTGTVQADRVDSVRRLAERTGGVAVLKGAGTLIAAQTPEGPALLGVCAHGNPGMATAGMGDVLSGIVGGLWAQRLDARAAAVLGVCLHSRAADLAVEQTGQRGLLATDLLPALLALTAR